MNLSDVLERERDALAAETRIARCPPFVALNNLDDVTRVPSTLRWSHPATVTEFKGVRGSAWIVNCPSLQSMSLWIATSNSYYRQAYVAFLNSVYSLELERIPIPFDVDHLYNRERARVYGLRYLRLALVDRAVNRSHGASVEKDLTTNEALRGAGSGMKLMDEITSMKYFGFLPPLRSDPRTHEIEAYCQFVRTRLNLDPDSVRESIRSLREKASKPWAKA